MEARRNARKYAVQAIFQFFFTKNEINRILEDFNYFKIYDGQEINLRYDRQFFCKIVNGVHDKKANILKLIEKNLSKEWFLDRIDLTMQSIMSLAIYELKECQSTPIKVIINEYVTISRLYLKKSDVGFVNGILDKIARDLRKI